MNRRVDYGTKNAAAPNKKQRTNVRRTNIRRTKALDATNTSRSSDKASKSSLSEQSSSALFRAWCHHHKVSSQQSLLRLLRAPLQSVMTWAVIAIAVVLPALLYLALHNVQQLSQDWGGQSTLSVYIKHQATPLAIEQLQQRLQSRPDIQHITLITSEQAKQQFVSHSGLGDVLSALAENPLPAVLLVEPLKALPDSNIIAIGAIAQLEELQTALSNEVLVDSVEFDAAWLERLYEIMNLAQRAILILGVLLSFGVLLIIGNTIRLTIESRRSEIVVIKMVGGTDGFIRCPFLYTGLWYGLGGGVLAVLLLLMANAWIEQPIRQLIVLYDSTYELQWLDSSVVVSVIMGASLLGWLGAGLAVSRHLKDIEPE